MAFEAHQHQISFLLGKKIYSIPRNTTYKKNVK